MPFAPIDTDDSGDTTLVAAVVGRKIRVLGYTLVGASAVSVKWKSGSTALSGAMPAAAPLSSSPGGNSFDPIPCLETASGEALILNLSAGVQVSGHLVYEIAG